MGRQTLCQKRAWLQEPRSHGNNDQFRLTVCPGALSQPAEVVRDSSRRDFQFAGNLFSGQTASCKIQDFRLPLAQRKRSCMRQNRLMAVRWLTLAVFRHQEFRILQTGGVLQDHGRIIVLEGSYVNTVILRCS